jgi:hypothetical protein
MNALELSGAPHMGRPSDLPDLRNYLAGMWAPGRPFWMTAGYHSLAAQRDPREAEAIAAWNYRQLMASELWWVSAEMVDLLDGAAAHVPPTVLTRELAPRERVFCYLEHPLSGIDARPENLTPDDLPPGSDVGVVQVDALAWGPAELPVTGPTFAVTVYRRWPEDDPGAGGLAGQWLPLGHSNWRIGADWSEPIGNPTGEPISAPMAASHEEDRRWLVALWALASQPKLIESRVEDAPRAARRRAARAGQELPTVRVVSLRRELRATAQRSAEPGPGRVYRHRWPVSGHWRQQPYGPGRAYRRPVYIWPYIKGPEGAPLKDAGAVVKVLKP